MAGKPYRVNGAWDSEAGVWIATSEDVPGLCCEAATFDELVEVVVALVPELLVANNAGPPPGVSEIPVEVIAERRTVARLVA